jgi:hypothetical protein
MGEMGWMREAAGRHSIQRAWRHRLTDGLLGYHARLVRSGTGKLLTNSCCLPNLTCSQIRSRVVIDAVGFFENNPEQKSPLHPLSEGVLNLQRALETLSSIVYVRRHSYGLAVLYKYLHRDVSMNMTRRRSKMDELEASYSCFNVILHSSIHQ